MKRFIVCIIFILFISLNVKSQEKIQNRYSYQDKFLLSTDILNSVKTRNINALETIAESLKLPYSNYIKLILPNYKKTERESEFPENEIYPESWYIRDSTLYNHYAADFYFDKLIQSLLNDMDGDTVFGKHIYLISGKNDKKVNEGIFSNYLGILFENKNHVKIINLEALTLVNNQLYTLRQANYNSYSKDNLPDYLLNKKTGDFDVFQFSNNEFLKYEQDIIYFDNVNYTAKTENKILLNPIDENEKSEVKTTNLTEVYNDTEALDRAEEMPTFSNGVKGLNKYLKENLKYPKEAQKKKLEGNVIVKFIVDKDGSIKNSVVLKDGVGGNSAVEALRLINKMPKWWPGKQNGKAVKVYYTLSIPFSLK